jgi:hypothetical protein
LAIRLAAVLVGFVSSTGVCHQSLNDSGSDVGTPHAPPLEIFGVSSDMKAMVVDAVGLFADAGLELPPLVIRSGESGRGCGGHDGIHRPHAGWSEIELCVDAPTGMVFHTVLHELAHAWATRGLSSDRRAEFQDLRGFVYWRNYDEAAWEDNGTEQAAEIIAWGVNDRPAGTVRIDRVSCGDLHAGFVALTGMEPLHGLTNICAPKLVPRF